jgi:hypothetical protein
MNDMKILYGARIISTHAEVLVSRINLADPLILGVLPQPPPTYVHVYMSCTSTLLSYTLDFLAPEHIFGTLPPPAYCTTTTSFLLQAVFTRTKSVCIPFAPCSKCPCQAAAPCTQNMAARVGVVGQPSADEWGRWPH